ncbi:hypothetical protein AnigIFM50267_001846 [Aspergillus niger]|nr:hypothetical protein AnigIFM50267_001846 [Aspergillus niger]
MGRYEFTGPSDSSDHDWEGGLEGARLYLGGAGIICRAFQGMDAAGIYGLVIFSLTRMVPKKDYATVTGVSGIVASLGLVMGPLFGGAITQHGDWRWVFLLKYERNIGPSSFWTRQGVLLRQIDFVGAFLVLGTSVFMVAALQEGNYDFGWDSSAVIIFFVLSGLCFPLFLWWQWFLSRRDLASQPILPWRLLVNRLFVGAILGSLTTGASLTVSVVEIPQRFQVVNSSSPLGAGVKLLVFAVSVPAGMMFCSIVAGRYPLPLVYLGIAGICLQVVGAFLYSSIPSETQIWRGQFAYLVLAGFGNGLAFGTFYSMLPLVVTIADQSISIGTGFQLRMLGGALGIAAATAILHSYTRSHLASFLPANEVDALAISSQIIDTLTPEMQVRVREIYA